MPTTSPNEPFKLSMRVDAPLWAAWQTLAARANHDPVDFIKMTMIGEVTRAKPPVLEPSEIEHLDRLTRLIQKVIGIAVWLDLDKDVELPDDITLQVFRAAMADDKFRRDYTTHIGGADPYHHGNPLKEVNRELGWRIKNALAADVVKDEDGKTVERRNLKGEVIQSYTLLKRRA